MHRYIHTYTHSHIYTYIHTYIHSFIHSFIHSLSPVPSVKQCSVRKENVDSNRIIFFPMLNPLHIVREKCPYSEL